MSQIRKAHSVEIIDRRLRDMEISGSRDVMELVGLHDELARVERKWREKAADKKDRGPRKRPLSDPKAMNLRFERLTRLVAAAAQRGNGVETAELKLLSRVAELLATRKPLPETPANSASS